MPRSVTVRHGFFPMWKGQGPSIKKKKKSALDEVLGEHDVTESDLMDIIGQTFFLSVYSENVLSTAPVQHPSQKTSYTEFPGPPTNINLDLHNRRARLQMWKTLAPEMSQIKSNSRDRQLWLADCRRFASDEIYFLSFLVSSVLDIVESLRPSGIVLGLRPPGPEFKILCLEGSVISFISPLSGGLPGPV